MAYDDFLMNLPSMASLRAFEAAGRLGGIRRAGDVLSIDHTAVSKHVRALENWLGTTLFNRDGHGLSLTDEGGTYHERVSNALYEIHKATQAVRGITSNSMFKIWCVPGFATQWLSDQISDFEKMWPGRTVEIRPTEFPAQLDRFEADVDIRFCGDDWGTQYHIKGCRTMTLAHPPLIVVASPEFVDRHPISSVADLLDTQLLHEEDHEQWLAWLRGNNITPTKPLGGVLMWHAHLALAAARSGRGLALANRFLVRSDIETRCLVEVAIPGCRNVAIGHYRFAARADRWHDKDIRKLREFLAKRASEESE